jgi:hypothetical protein
VFINQANITWPCDKILICSCLVFFLPFHLSPHIFLSIMSLLLFNYFLIFRFLFPSPLSRLSLNHKVRSQYLLYFAQSKSGNFVILLAQVSIAWWLRHYAASRKVASSSPDEVDFLN